MSEAKKVNPTKAVEASTQQTQQVAQVEASKGDELDKLIAAAEAEGKRVFRVRKNAVRVDH